MAEVDPRDTLIAELRAQVAALTARVAELEARLRQDSSNSSRPPSSDAPGARRQGKKATGRRPGGQPGHKKQERRLLPPEQVQRFVELVPKRCEECGQGLVGRDTKPQRHQVVEVPPLSAHVTEYRSHALDCEACGTVTREPVPAYARSAFGDRLGALASLLVGKYRLSKRLVKDALSDVLGVQLCVGSVANLEGEMAEALEKAGAEAREEVKQAQRVHADETGWVQGRAGGRGQRAWMWLVATGSVAVFHIDPSRGGKVARALLGEDFAGLLVSDRWSGYEWHDAGLRQVCWAHLTRDWQGFIDRGGEGGRVGEALMRQRNRFFAWYHRVRDGALSREDFEKRMREVEREVGRLLREAVACAEKKTAGMAREMLRWEKCLWTFVDVADLEPTNNFAERCLRHAVMYRKTSFGTQSEEGSRFVERILTAVTTLKLQRRDVLAFLCDTLKAHRRGLRTPSLLPIAQATQLANAA
jgi:transposase